MSTTNCQKFRKIALKLNELEQFFDFVFPFHPLLCIEIIFGNYFRHHIATHSLSSPITSETVPLKFPRNFQKFPKKLEALLLVAQLGTGNCYRF